MGAKCLGTNNRVSGNNYNRTNKDLPRVGMFDVCGRRPNPTLILIFYSYFSDPNPNPNPDFLLLFL